MAADHERLAAERDPWAAELCERTKRSTSGPRRNTYKMVHPVRFCGGAKRAGPISRCGTLEYQLPRPPITMWRTRSSQIRDLSSGRLEQSSTPDKYRDGDDRLFGMGERLICGILLMPTRLQPLFWGDGQGLWGYGLTMRGCNHSDAAIHSASTRISPSPCELFDS